MSVYFFDSSALAKYFVDETGSTWVRTIFSNKENGIVIAQVTSVELISAFARRNREGLLSAQGLTAARLLSTRLIARRCSVIALREPVIETAQLLIIKHGLRAYDSIQLASASIAKQALEQRNIRGLVFVCSDDRLGIAAQAEELEFADPAKRETDD